MTTACRINTGYYRRIRGFHTHSYINFDGLCKRWKPFICCSCNLFKYPYYDKRSNNVVLNRLNGKKCCYSCYMVEWKKKHEV